MQMVGFGVLPFGRRYICVFLSDFVIKLAYALGIGPDFEQDTKDKEKEVRFWFLLIVSI